MSEADGETDVQEPGLGTLIAVGVLTFALLTPIATYLLAFNSTQAVLIGGLSGLSAATAAKLSGRRRVTQAGE